MTSRAETSLRLIFDASSAAPRYTRSPPLWSVRSGARFVVMPASLAWSEPPSAAAPRV